MSALPDSSVGYCRSMARVDMKDVCEIEQRAYEFPWNKGVFLDCIRAGYHCRILQLSAGIGAYGIMSVGAEEAHILNLCVNPEWTGKGLAQALLEHLLSRAATDRAHTVFLEVRPSNHRALKLYGRAGFCELGIRPDYYPARNSREDAILMAKTLC